LVREEVGLQVSAGIASTKFVAKIASDLGKPDGLVRVAHEETKEFLEPLPITRLWGVGKATFRALNRLGVTTIGDLSRIPAERLRKDFGKHGEHLHLLSQGIDQRQVEPDRQVKSIGREETFAEDLTQRESLAREILSLATRVARRVRRHGLRGKTVTLKALKTVVPDAEVVLMTAFGTVEKAVEAMRAGAYDFVEKPLKRMQMVKTVRKAAERHQLIVENKDLRQQLSQLSDRSIVGSAASLRNALEIATQAAPSSANVLILGESGTGKELLARFIHERSGRGKFVGVNLSALPETIVESELFGHEKGAFTGADRRKEGKFLQAHNGSLFLDEISEMSLTMQVKLLRVLQEREITRVGGEAVIPVNVRVIAATNKDLPDLIDEGRFREDLYYRLNVVSLTLPLLRARREDIPLLTGHFLKRFAEKNHKEIKGITPQAMDRLIRYDWPGNVRELMNAVERGVILARSPSITKQDLSLDLPLAEGGAGGKTTLKELQRHHILSALERHGGNRSRAARELGITRQGLSVKIKKYGL